MLNINPTVFQHGGHLKLQAEVQNIVNDEDIDNDEYVAALSSESTIDSDDSELVYYLYLLNGYLSLTAPRIIIHLPLHRLPLHLLL